MLISIVDAAPSGEPGADMYAEPEWEVVRKRNGWVNIYNAGDDFVDFLNKQEAVIGGLMKELGFL